MCHLADNVFSKRQVQWQQSRVTVVPRRSAGRRLTQKCPQVKNLNGDLIMRTLGFTACHLCNKRSSGGSSRERVGGGWEHSPPRCRAFHCLPLSLYLDDLVMLNIIGQLFLALWKKSSIFLVNYKKFSEWEKRVFAVCLTSFILSLLLLIKKKIYSIFRIHLDKACPWIWFAVWYSGKDVFRRCPSCENTNTFETLS